MIESPHRGLIAAAAVFTVALFVFGSALVRAVGTTPPAPMPDATGAAADGDTAARREPLSMSALMLALDNDPFQPTRERPPVRYRLPGDVDPGPPPPAPDPPPLPQLVAHGTIVDPVPERSVALIQLEDGPPVLLPVGSSIAGFRVAEVTREAVVVTDGERQVWLRVPGPQQTVVAAPEPERRGRQNARDRREEQATSAAAEQIRARLMQLTRQLDAARQSGASPAVLQTLQQAIERTASQSGLNMRVIMREATPARRTVPDTSSNSTPRVPEIRD